MRPLNYLVLEHGLFSFVVGGGWLLVLLESSSSYPNKWEGRSSDITGLLKNLKNAVEF